MAVRRWIRPPRGRQAWRAHLAYTLFAGATGLLALIGCFLLLAVGALSLAGPGLLALPAALRATRRFTDLHRRRAAAWLGTDVPSPSRPAAGDGGGPVRLRTTLTDPATWYGLGWLALHAVAGTVVGALALGLCGGVLSWLTTPLWWWAVPHAEFAGWEITTWPAALSAVALAPAYAGLAALLLPALSRGHALATRGLLAPRRGRASLARRVEELTVSRADALDAHAAELRRIEHDLHDGAQAGLVAVSLRLGLIRRALEQRPEALSGLPQLPELVDSTQRLAEQTLSSLRATVRAVHPPVLDDHGLAEAARGLAAACPVPTDLDVATEPPGARAPAALEAAAYFVLAEALTNVARHSGAARAEVRLSVTPRAIRVSVRDDGRGGAAEGPGTGLRGIRRRVAALDGVTDLSSPPGGPTLLHVELPCGS
ncbi:sensor histidine kinase [Streptomyces huiliensis]|uniref:sensor histidine kinase n=1 Tax=Streptomyces huiliensis TaxID=2876027 RepID=UPI001CBC660F|nr:sensor histidine kinase [Streptomyces huiliensis]MBZ4320484.1 sensor domain-containing protein [Streptomyces huiliensis]